MTRPETKFADDSPRDYVTSTLRMLTDLRCTCGAGVGWNPRLTRADGMRHRAVTPAAAARLDADHAAVLR